jgi:hypothetical protein
MQETAMITQMTMSEKIIAMERALKEKEKALNGRIPAYLQRYAKEETDWHDEKRNQKLA